MASLYFAVSSYLRNWVQMQAASCIIRKLADRMHYDNALGILELKKSSLLSRRLPKHCADLAIPWTRNVESHCGPAIFFPNSARAAVGSSPKRPPGRRRFYNSFKPGGPVLATEPIRKAAKSRHGRLQRLKEGLAVKTRCQE